MKKIMKLLLVVIVSLTLTYISFGQKLKLHITQKTSYTAVLPVPSPDAPNQHGF